MLEVQLDEVKRVSSGPHKKSKQRDKGEQVPSWSPTHPATVEGSLIPIHQPQALLLRTRLSDSWMQTAVNGTDCTCS